MLTATIIGRLGRDPETKKTNSGHTVTTLAIATDYGYGDRKTTTWVRASLWGDSAAKFASYLQKGSGVVVSGELYARDHNEKTYLEIDAKSWGYPPDAKRNDGQRSEPSRQEPARQPAPSRQSNPYPQPQTSAYDDDVPF